MSTRNRRKPLPYAAAGLVDEASMFLVDAMRALRPVVESREISRDAIMQAIGRVILYTSSAQARLIEIKQIPVEEQD